MSDKKALSVKNPTSYLICLGMKTVENHTWKTDYRGRIYIHSSGDEEVASLVDYEFPDRLVDLIDELEAFDWIKEDTTIDEVKAKLSASDREKFKEALLFVEKMNAYQEVLLKHYDGLDAYSLDFDADYEKKFEAVLEKNGFFHKNLSIIGHVDLVDIVQDSTSVWAEAGCYHWILENPVLYDTPLINVKGALRLFDVSHIV